MITVFKNADFITLNDENSTYSVMVINGKRIAYLGYNIPLCYDSEKVVDLNGKSVIPLVNNRLCLTYRQHAECSVLAEGEKADFAVVDKNILKDPDDIKVLQVYINGRKKD